MSRGLGWPWARPRTKTSSRAPSQISRFTSHEESQASRFTFRISKIHFSWKMEKLGKGFVYTKKSKTIRMIDNLYVFHFGWLLEASRDLCGAGGWYWSYLVDSVGMKGIHVFVRVWDVSQWKCIETLREANDKIRNVWAWGRIGCINC